MEEPQDPIGEMLSAGIALHTMYINYINSGFTSSEALELCKAMVAEQTRFVLERGLSDGNDVGTKNN